MNNINYWVIGFLWGSARFSGDYLLVQNINKKLLLRVKELTGINNKIFETITTTGKTSHRLKIRKDNSYIKYLLTNGYEGRIGSIERQAPTTLPKNKERDFLKGYFSTHYTLDIGKNGDKTFPRLRFYGSKPLVNLLNNHLHQELDTTIKKVGNHNNNEICKIIYYQSKKEVPKIIKYLKLEGN